MLNLKGHLQSGFRNPSGSTSSSSSDRKNLKKFNKSVIAQLGARLRNSDGQVERDLASIFLKNPDAANLTLDKLVGRTDLDMGRIASTMDFVVTESLQDPSATAEFIGSVGTQLGARLRNSDGQVERDLASIFLKNPDAANLTLALLAGRTDLDVRDMKRIASHMGTVVTESSQDAHAAEHWVAYFSPSDGSVGAKINRGTRLMMLSAAAANPMNPMNPMGPMSPMSPMSWGWAAYLLRVVKNTNTDTVDPFGSNDLRQKVHYLNQTYNRLEKLVEHGTPANQLMSADAINQQFNAVQAANPYLDLSAPVKSLPGMPPLGYLASSSRDDFAAAAAPSPTHASPAGSRPGSSSSNYDDPFADNKYSLWD